MELLTWTILDLVSKNRNAGVVQWLERHYNMQKVVRIRCMQTTKIKGDLGELKVATDLSEKNFPVSFPYGDNRRYDLIVEREDGSLQKVQVKYTESDGKVISVRLRTTTRTTDKQLSFKTPKREEIDFVAVYDKTTDQCFYLPVSLCGGKNQIQLRLQAPKNGQKQGVHWAKDYATLA